MVVDELDEGVHGPGLRHDMATARPRSTTSSGYMQRPTCRTRCEHHSERNGLLSCASACSRSGGAGVGERQVARTRNTHGSPSAREEQAADHQEPDALHGGDAQAVAINAATPSAGAPARPPALQQAEARDSTTPTTGGARDAEEQDEVAGAT